MESGVETYAVIYLSLCNMFIVQFFESNLQLTFIIKQRLKNLKKVSVTERALKILIEL